MLNTSYILGGNAFTKIHTATNFSILFTLLCAFILTKYHLSGLTSVQYMNTILQKNKIWMIVLPRGFVKKNYDSWNQMFSDIQESYGIYLLVCPVQVGFNLSEGVVFFLRKTGKVSVYNKSYIQLSYRHFVVFTIIFRFYILWFLIYIVNYYHRGGFL